MNGIDVLFVTPPSSKRVYQGLSKFAAIEPPVWSGLLAHALQRQGHRVEILDAEAEGLTTYQTAFRIRSASPLLAVFSIYGHQPSASTQCMPAATDTAEIVDSLVGPRILKLALGTHPSALPERTLHEGFDYVCQGEGLLTISELLYCLKTGANPDKQVAGLWSHGGGQPFRSAQNIPCLDQVLPRQAWDLLDMKRYRALYWHQWTARREQRHDLGGPYEVSAGGYASVQTSLGCPFKCTFCCINAPFGGPGYRMWSGKNVARQIYDLVENYGITNIKIPDEMFVLNKAHVEEVCNALIEQRVHEHLNMWAYARIDTVKDERLLALMRKAGFRWLGIGIESGSKHVRNGVEKGRFGTLEILEAVDRVRKNDLHIGANYIFGLPDDTEESMKETLALACNLNTAHANFYCAMAYPGSALHAEAKARGWRLPEDPGGPGWLGYSQHSYESLPLRTEALTHEQVLDFRDQAFLIYHQRPKYQALLYNSFGPETLKAMQDITAAGMPKRLHRNPPAPAPVGSDDTIPF